MRHLLRPEDVERIRAKYPDKQTRASKRAKPLSNGIVLKTASSDYLSLRSAVASLRSFDKPGGWVRLSPVFKYTLDMSNSLGIRRKQWIHMARLKKYRNMDIWVWGGWTSHPVTIEDYIVSKNSQLESKQMLEWWHVLVDRISEGIR